MIEGLQPYGEYKESGSKWLGKSPAHWEAVPLGRILVQRIEKNRPIKTKDILSLSLHEGVIPYSDKKTGGNKAKDDLSAYNLAYPGDIVLNSMNVVVGSVGLSKYFGAVSPVYYVLHTREKSDSILFFDALFQDKTFQQSLWVLGNGILFLQSKTSGKFNTIRMRIPMGALRHVIIPHPSSSEQTAIVKFLDHANRKIDRFIRAKRKLIGLLNEQKQAIIHRAVTRGLNPNAHLKPSGIPWLGDIPQHWEVTALRRHWRVTDCKHVTVPFVEDGIPLASVVEVQSFTLNLAHCKKTKPSWYRLLIDGNRKPKRGDLIYCRNASVGACALVETDIDFAMGQDVCLIRSTHQNQRFLNYLLHSPFMDRQLAFLLVGSTFKRINVADIKALTVLIPPREEQDAICTHLDSELQVYDAAIARTEREIALMQEYRTRLTADVVTGKLDIRPAAANLPDLPSEVASRNPEEEIPLQGQKE